MPRWIPIGSVRRPHGLRGQLRVQLNLERPKLLAPGTQVQVGEKLFFVEKRGPAPGPEDVFLLTLREVQGRDQAEVLKGKTLFLSREDLGEDLEDDDFLFVDLEGLEAVDAQGKSLGTITAVSVLAGRAMAHLDDLLIPLDSPFLQSVDFEAGQAHFDLPEGLLESQRT